MHTETKEKLALAIDDNSNRIWDLAQRIHANPELPFQEYQSSKWLTEVLENEGFKVQMGVAGMETAFQASWTDGGNGPTVALLCEYDALPKIGHGCGHNLIGPISIGAALALKQVCPDIPGRILVLGTPAEEGGGGKIIMCDKNVFDNIDAVMMCHPKNKTMVSRGALAACRLTLKFYGVSSHASSFPEKGISALEALVNSYNAINSLRQFLLDDVRIHGIITHGGESANIVPDYAEAKFMVRAATLTEMEKVKEKVLNAVRYSAKAVGAGFEYDEGLTYGERNTNMALANRFKLHLEQVGESVVEPAAKGEVGSSDIGNVSQVVPAIHPYIKICDENVVNHSQDFTDAAITDQAREGMIKASKAMAMTAFDLCMDKPFLDSVKEEFSTWKSNKASK